MDDAELVRERARQLGISETELECEWRSPTV
jgi:hypothetical protein